MTNAEIVAVLKNIAHLLKWQKESIFKIRAYERVANAIEELSVDVELLVKEDRLKEIPGVGEAIDKKITELVNTGRLEYYEKLKSESSGAADGKA